VKKIALLNRLLRPLLLIGAMAVLTAAFYMFNQNVEAIKTDALDEMQKLEQVLVMSKKLVIERVNAAMSLLKQKSDTLGPPNINGQTVLNGQTIPNLQFGFQAQTKQTELVDDLTRITNGKATIFVKQGTQFIRIATNISNQNNTRAIGTRLDPNGNAIKHLTAGKPFYGVVDILGQPYISGYEPIRDQHHQVIGAWYVGYKVNNKTLDEAIKKWRFLGKGFAAITDNNHRVHFLSDHVKIKTVRNAIKDTDKKWLLTHKIIPEWQFHAFIAVPLSEVYLNSAAPLYPLLILSIIFGIILLMVAQYGIQRFVLTPLGGEPETALRLINQIEQGHFEPDTTTAKPDTLIANLLKMRTRLGQMLAEIQANADRLSTSSSVFQHAHDGIFITDANANIIETNPAFTDITGYTRQEALHRQPYALGFAHQLTANFADLLDSPKASQSKRSEVWCQKKNGQTYAAWLDIFPVKNEHNEIRHYVGIFSDHTIAKAQKTTLERLAYHDALTQLPNRVLFSNQLQKSLAEIATTTKAIAICYVDLDDFKPINDQYGHAIGDRLLILLAQRLRQNCRNQDMVARLGGDEFAILLNGLPTAHEYSHALDRILDAIEQPFQIADHTFYISASIGFTVYPNDDNPPDTLLRHADHAMYHAKTHGGKQHHQFDATTAQYSQQKQRLKQEIVEALKHNQFSLYYQPQIDLKSGLITGMEALIRWHHPKRGLLNPDDFLPMIENTNLIIEIGEWVIHNALTQLDHWQQHHKDMHIGINIAAHHLTSSHFTHHLAQALQKHPNMAPNNINIEITEQAAVSDFKKISQSIQHSKKLGIRFSLDHFGTGYASLIHLRQLPIDTIKIDRALTHNMMNNPIDLALITAVIQLSQELNQQVIAQGAQTNKHLRLLKNLNCHTAQGDGIAKPMPANQVSNWLSANNPFRF